MLLYQPIDGYCYNSDTIFLFDFISKFNIKNSVLEIGSGCGILGLLVKQKFDNINLVMIEKQEIMYQFSLKNRDINGLNAEILLADFLEYQFCEKFDFIISNPPFYDGKNSNSVNSIKQIARYDSYLPLEEFIRKVATILKPKGEFIFCYDVRAFDKVCETLLKYKIKIESVRLLYSKLSKSSNLVLIKAKKGSKSVVEFLPPLIMFDEFGYSQEAKAIFEKVGTYSIKCQIN